MNEESVLQNSTSKGVLNYETVVNMHIMRSNQLFQSVTSQKGVGIPVIMSLYATVMALDGLIRNKRQPKEYEEKISGMIEAIKGDFKILGDATTDDEKFVNVWFKVIDAYSFQLQQMNDLGLTPAEDVDDILPTIVEKVGKVIEVPPWQPSPGDYDYKKDLGLEIPNNIEYRSLEKPKKPESEMTEFEKQIENAKDELAIEMSTNEYNESEEE